MDTFVDMLPWIAAGLALAAGLVVGYALLLARRPPARVATDAGLMDTLRATPLAVAVFLDVNDLLLDSFGAPLAWWLLGRAGLAGLRKVAVVEALVPGTQLLPVFTIAWLVARLRTGASPRRRALSA